MSTSSRPTAEASGVNPQIMPDPRVAGFRNDGARFCRGRAGRCEPAVRGLRSAAAGHWPADIDGFELLSRLRSRGSTLPVLLLTARDEISDRVHGLNLGADDYVDRGLPYSPIPHDLDRPVFFDGDYGGLKVRLVSLPTLSAGERVIITVAETTLKRQRGQRTIIATLAAWELALACTLLVIGWLATGRALTRLDRLQDDLARRSLRDLAPVDESQVPIEVRPLTTALNSLLERIGAAARAQQSFLTDVAHQLRTPLAGLVTQLSVAQRQNDLTEVRNSIALMQSAATRTVRLANQLLALARAEPSGFHAERLRPVNLTDVIERCVDDWVRLADPKHIELHFELNSASVLGDEFLLRELLDNLLTNAVQYTPAGGHVTIHCVSTQTASIVFVEDSGPGIAPSERSKVFNRFYRVPGTNPEGSGLGLTIAREIARAHMAEIEIATAASGRGTRVTVTFPAPRSP